MEKQPKSTGQQTPPRDKKFQSKRSPKSAPGPGGSQESERIEYHEEPSPKAGHKPYDHQPEKDLEH